jgi:hypothetical protein
MTKPPLVSRSKKKLHSNKTIMPIVFFNMQPIEKHIPFRKVIEVSYD